MSFYSKYTGEEVEQRLDAVSEIAGQVGKISGALSEVSGRVDTNATNIAKVAEKVGSIENDVDVIDESVGALGERVQELGSLTTSVENLSANVTAIGSGVEQLAERVEGVASELDNKQGVLESGVNIKTINGESILGAGDIKVQGGGIGGEVEDVTEIQGNEFVLLMDGDKVLRVPMSVLKAWLGVPSEPSEPSEPDQPTTPDVDENGYIVFKDAEVKRVLMANGVSSDGVGITLADAEKVTKINAYFQENTLVESFDELRFFTSLKSLGTAEWSSWASPFIKCTSLESVVLPPSVTSINFNVFLDCANLKRINLESVESLWHQAFFNCTSLAIDVVMPKLKEIKNATFANTGIKRILDLGELTATTGGWGQYEGSFSYCKDLELVILPNTITAFGIGTFSNCTKLKDVVMKAITPPTLSGGVFDNCTALTNIYVPDASVTAYQEATNWSVYADRIKGISSLQTDNAELYEEIKEYL